MSLKKSITLIIIILLIDQISKIYIKTNFVLQEGIYVFSWFEIIFVENDGMAWGTKISDFMSFISDRTAKVILTSFRIIAIFGIGYWLFDFGYWMYLFVISRIRQRRRREILNYWNI